jgi:type IV pilus assembly protein PilY1
MLKGLEMFNSKLKPIVALFALIFSGSSLATTIKDDFTQATNTNDWKALDYACLTAGTSGNNNTGNSKIPGCNLSSPDAAGSGALRLTPASSQQKGAIVSNYTFPTDQGLQVVFTTYTYGGNGADGMTFFLMDGATEPNLGSTGGSLSYSCSVDTSNTVNGITSGFLAVGMDEYGNFLNRGDNTATGWTSTGAPQLSTSGNSGVSQRIGLRGSGTLNWTWLNANYPSYYPSTLSSTGSGTGTQKDAVAKTCQTGTLWNYSNIAHPVDLGSTSTTTGSGSSGKLLMDYKAVPGGVVVLPSTSPIWNSSMTSKSTAKPITYKLTLTQTGKLNLQYSYNGGTYQSVIKNQSISDPNAGLVALPQSFRFGFTGSTGASTNIHEITCFTAEPTQSASSAGANSIPGVPVSGGTQIYLAGYNPNNWWGTLGAYPLVISGNTLSVSNVANWDGDCVLTGGGCSAMGTTNGVPNNTITVEPPSSRQLLTWDGSSGIPLQWSNLTSSQQIILNSSDGQGQNRLDWLRGVRSQEESATPAGLLRARDSVLGDIIDSSPTWVGAPSMNYASPFGDAIYGSASAPENLTGAQTYSNYTSTNATRTNIVYSGGNDGLLHGFRAGSYSSSLVYNSANNDGLEVLGYMPSKVLANTNVVGLTSPTYPHSYFVDATPGVGDLFYNNSWHTWLVGGLGEGGKEIYALDVTDPTQFSEANASTLIKGDWTDSTLAHLGNTYGTPLIRRLHNGQWAIIFGNGYGSSDYTAGVYIGLVNSTTGVITFKWLGAKTGTSSSPDGIAYVSPADLDGDRIVDYLYAGDLLGNVWRFDLTSSNPSDWGVSKFGNGVATPLFSSGTAQPISSSIAVAATNVGGAQRIIVMFGTGKKTAATATTPDSYATGTQTVYGIWDSDMHNWNAGVTTTNNVNIPASAVKYAELTAPQSITKSVLTQQVATNSGIYRTITSNTVCWKGSTTCTPSTNNTKYGWYLNLPDTNEQVIYNPVIVGGALVLNTVIPPVTIAGQCTLQTPTGWTMSFNIESGGTFPQGFFPDANGSYTGSTQTMGLKVNAVGSPLVVIVNTTSGSTSNIISQTTNNTASVSQINPQNSIVVKRITWEELR